VAYDGSAYCGFQVQPNGVSVQAVLTDAFSRLFGFPCSVTGCSRTDSGVHAIGFCAAVAPRGTDAPGDGWCPVPVGKIHRAVNMLLPDDIAVTAAAEVDDSFHPRYNVVQKTYEYRIHDGAARNPFLLGKAYHTGRPITDAGMERMRAAAAYFVGRHDFAGYMASGSKIVDTVRCVSDAQVCRASDGTVVFRVSADGFLYNMVRIMAGTLLDCAYGRLSPEDAQRAVREKNRTLAGYTAPPEGLYLCQVEYDREIRWMCV